LGLPIGDQAGIAATLGQLGHLAEITGDEAQAAELYRESLRICEQLGASEAKVAKESLKRLGVNG
jgi:hypothetical protein